MACNAEKAGEPWILLRNLQTFWILKPSFAFSIIFGEHKRLVTTGVGVTYFEVTPTHILGIFKNVNSTSWRRNEKGSPTQQGVRLWLTILVNKLILHCYLERLLSVQIKCF